MSPPKTQAVKGLNWTYTQIDVDWHQAYSKCLQPCNSCGLLDSTLTTEPRRTSARILCVTSRVPNLNWQRARNGPFLRKFRKSGPRSNRVWKRGCDVGLRFRSAKWLICHERRRKDVQTLCVLVPFHTASFFQRSKTIATETSKKKTIA